SARTWSASAPGRACGSTGPESTPPRQPPGNRAVGQVTLGGSRTTRHPGGRMITVDLNCDLGEGATETGTGGDEDLLAVVTSANVACGFHAGDPSTMRVVTAAAVARGVAIGAHVAYRDLEGFGRR